MLDADADLGRRAWLPCTRCQAECGTCNAKVTCDRHWCYLLASETRLVFIQCSVCHHRWWYDTECGAGDYRSDRYYLLDFPESPGKAA